jgi:cell division protein FtsN
MNANQLTDEQRQLLAQMQADMRQQPTQLNEVPWNEQTPAQRQQTLQRRQPSNRFNNSSGANSAGTAARTQPRVTEQPYQQPQQQTRTVSLSLFSSSQSAAAKAGGSAVSGSAADASAYHRAAAENAAGRAGHQRDRSAEADGGEKDERRWMVQCGSFKGAEQAETVRAQLAFEGFDSRITTNNGWNRVVIGPVKGKENADGTISFEDGRSHKLHSTRLRGLKPPKSPHLSFNSALSTQGFCFPIL